MMLAPIGQWIALALHESGINSTLVQERATMMAGWKALFVAVVMALFAAAPAHAFIFDRDEDYGRLVQSVNLGLADQVYAMPHPDGISADPVAARAALAEWARGASAAYQGQLRRSADLRDPPRSRNRARRAAMQAQAEAMETYMTAFHLMLDQVRYFAAASPETLRSQRAWYADAFYDARTLTLRVQKELAFSQAALAEDPLVSTSLLVLAHSTDIQLELSRAAHNRAHNSLLNSRDVAGRMAAAVLAMRTAIAEARTHLPSSSADYAVAWQDCLDHEALIADAAERLSANLRADGDRGFSGQGQAIVEVLALYRDRPTRTVSFAMTFTL
jgi:hypothetical protein